MGRPSLSEEETAELGRHVALSLLREAHGKWRVAVRYAAMEGLEQLASYAHEKKGIVVPPHAGLRPRRRAQVLSEALGLAAAREVSEHLSRAGIRHAFTKGAANAPLYAERGLRPFTDLDLLVDRDDAARAGARLAELGYGAVHRNEMEITFVAPEAYPVGRDVDLHFAGGLPRQFAFDVRGVIDRAVPGDIPRLSAEDEVLFLAGHMGRNKFRDSGRSACDIAAIARAVPVDWEIVASRARDWRMRAITWISLLCARRACGADIPAEALAGMAPHRARRAWLVAWLDTSRVSPLRLRWRAGGKRRGRAAHFLLAPLLSDFLSDGVRFTVSEAMRRALSAFAGR